MATADLLDRCAFPDGDLHLGVSGGTDSVAMAVLARAAGRPFTIWHVHHGVRPGADADAAFVEGLAAEWGVPFELRCLDLDPAPNFEARARTARYEVMPDGVCVAHTADDRAETVLLNLFRGAGLAGTAARMRSAHRPILALSRTDTVAVCDEAGITPAPSFNATNLLRDRYLFAFQSPLKRMEKPGYNCGSKHRRMGSLFTATTTASPPQSMIVQPVRLGMPPPDQVFIGD